MNLKKALPVLLLIVMAVITLLVKRFNETSHVPVSYERNASERSPRTPVGTDATLKLDRTTSNLYYTKHAKCRMRCRHISQQEVQDILINGTINYNKTNLNDPRGPAYALEGFTKDRQRVRIIFAPKQKYLTVVTVIDLEVEYECSCK